MKVTCRTLKEAIDGMSVDEIKSEINLEMMTLKRKTLVRRLHQIYTAKRARVEREQLLKGGTLP